MKQFSQFDLLAIGASATLAVICLADVSRSPDLIWAALFFAGCAVCLLLRPRIERLRQAKRLRVEHDADSIRSCFGGAVLASIRWDELDEVAVFTHSSGPGRDDVVWVFTNFTRSQTISIAGACPGFPALLESLQGLPGFDNVTLLEALGSVTLGRFVVWRRPRA